MRDHGDFDELPSLKALRAFEVVTRCLNFRLAAEELGVTQGAVAQQVRALEAELGLKLFERHARGLTLTEGGRAYGQTVRRAFELIVQGTRALKPAAAHVTISVTPTMAAKWLIPRLPRFTSHHPEVDLRVLATERVCSFAADAVDLAIRYGRPPFGPGLDAELLLENTVVAVAAPSLVGEAVPLDPRRLLRFALIHDGHDAWPPFLAQVDISATRAAGKNIRFNQTTLAIDAAIAGQGLALASPFFVEDDIAKGRLVQVLPQALRTGLDYYLVWPRRARREAPLAQVRAWLLEQARG